MAQLRFPFTPLPFPLTSPQDATPPASRFPLPGFPLPASREYAMRTRSIPALIGLVFATACLFRGSPPVDRPRTTLLVRNDNYLDYNIYLLYSAERVRLGTARGLSTTRFTIPRQYVFGITSLQFLADPIGGQISPVSERVNVSPGDEIEMIIPSTPETAK